MADHQTYHVINIYITDLVRYTNFHWFFNHECQHIFGKQTGYKSVSHAVSTREHYITPRAGKGRYRSRVDMACDIDFDM
jgi:hypothetical protein